MGIEKVDPEEEGIMEVVFLQPSIANLAVRGANRSSSRRQLQFIHCERSTRLCLWNCGYSRAFSAGIASSMGWFILKKYLSPSWPRVTWAASNPSLMPALNRCGQSQIS